MNVEARILDKALALSQMRETMESISREPLKAAIDQLDQSYLDLVYRFIHQFSYQPKVQLDTPLKSSFSERWRGKFSTINISSEAIVEDPRLAYLASRYRL